MAIVNWIGLIEDRLLSRGLSLKTDITVLQKNKVYFNEALRDLIHEYPNKRFQHIILSMKDYHEVEDIYSILDEQNKATLKRHYIEEDKLTVTVKKRRSKKK